MQQNGEQPSWLFRSPGFQPNAFKDWKMRRPKIFYPEGITEHSPGSRSDSDDHPGLVDVLDWHPERRARSAVVTPDFPAFSDPLPGSNTPVCARPRVFVAIAPRPGANFSDPCRDQESSDEIESLQALGFQPGRCRENRRSRQDARHPRQAGSLSSVFVKMLWNNSFGQNARSTILNL